MKGFKRANRKKNYSVKREDLWTAEEHAIFMHYCDNLRLLCYHAMALETGARPGELLKLKIGDIKKQISPTGKPFVDISVGAEGKTREARSCYAYGFNSIL